MNFISVKTDDDIKELVDLANEIWHEYWPTMLSYDQIEYMLQKFQSENAIKEQLNKGKYIYNMFEEKGRVVGYYGVFPQKNYLFLSKFYIKNGYRGMGIGKQAFEQIKKIALQNDLFLIRLTVNRNNHDAISAYEKLGMEIVNESVTDIGNGFVMDDYIMEIRL